MSTFLSTSKHLLTKHRLVLITLFFGVFIPLLIFGKLAEDVLTLAVGGAAVINILSYFSTVIERNL